jgi:TatD DNase family protein
MFTDSHSHIQFIKEFPDVENVIRRAEAAGVTRQIIVGCAPYDSRLAVEFVRKHADKNFWAAVGVHPHDSNLLSDQVVKEFRNLVKTEKKVVAIGEIGLDYFRNLQTKDVQERAFRGQLQLAKELDVPAIIHVRDAWEEALKIIDEEGNKKVVLHCYSGNFTQAYECWQKGFYISFAGVLTYPKNEQLRDIALAVPDSQILIETDCPYLTPQIHRGKRNEPSYVVETAKTLAELKGITLEEAGKITTENAVRCFGLE